MKAAFCILAGTLLLSGCQGKPPEPVAVAGKVVGADGAPVSDLQLVFHPQDDLNRGDSPRPPTDKQGRFSFSCIKGRYHVTAIALPTRNADSPEMHGPAGKVPLPSSSPDWFPASYRAPETTPWKIDIPDTGKQDLVLTLKKHGER